MTVPFDGESNSTIPTKKAGKILHVGSYQHEVFRAQSRLTSPCGQQGRQCVGKSSSLPEGVSAFPARILPSWEETERCFS